MLARSVKAADSARARPRISTPVKIANRTPVPAPVTAIKLGLVLSSFASRAGKECAASVQVWLAIFNCLTV